MFVVNFDALQAIFKSKGDKLSSSAECRVRTQGLRHQIASRLNARCQTDWVLEHQAKNLNSTAHSCDRRAFSPLDPTAGWLSHLALAIYMFVVVNFDALAQASDLRIQRRQVVSLCWMQDSNPRSQTPNRQQTECWQTDWAMGDQAKNLNSTAHPYDQWTFSPFDPTAGWLSHLALAIYMFVAVRGVYIYPVLITSNYVCIYAKSLSIAWFDHFYVKVGKSTWFPTKRISTRLCTPKSYYWNILWGNTGLLLLCKRMGIWS